jgi:hypothetical protein
MAIDLAKIWNDYGLMIILGAVVLVLSIARFVNWIKARAKMRKMKPTSELAKDMQKKLSETEIPPPPPPKELPAFDMSEYENLLGGKETEAEKENVIEQINVLNKKMRRESNDMDKKIKEDRERLESGLKDVLKNKQKLLEYGKEMSELYKVYEEREKQLGLTMVALNRVLGEEGSGGSK